MNLCFIMLDRKGLRLLQPFKKVGSQLDVKNYFCEGCLGMDFFLRRLEILWILASESNGSPALSEVSLIVSVVPISWLSVPIVRQALSL